MTLKKYPLPLFLACIFLVLTSCEKEAVSYFDTIKSPPASELSSADFLRIHVDQDIIFHYSVIDKANDRYSGWIIDNEGELRKYALQGNAEFLQQAVLNEDNFATLIESSNKAEYDVDLDKLVDMYQRIAFLNLTNIVTTDNPTPSEVTKSFYTYKFSQSSSRSGSNSCGCSANGGTCTSHGVKDLARIVLQEEGTQIRKNNDSAALQMVAWLSNIKDAN